MVSLKEELHRIVWCRNFLDGGLTDYHRQQERYWIRSYPRTKRFDWVLFRYFTFRYFIRKIFWSQFGKRQVPNNKREEEEEENRENKEEEEEKK